MAAASRPVRSATVTASRIVSTVTSGGKPMKLAPRLAVNQVSPSPVKRPRTAVASSAPGIVTDAPASWSSRRDHADEQEQPEEQQERVGQPVADALDGGEQPGRCGWWRGGLAHGSVTCLEVGRDVEGAAGGLEVGDGGLRAASASQS